MVVVAWLYDKAQARLLIHFFLLRGVVCDRWLCGLSIYECQHLKTLLIHFPLLCLISSFSSPFFFNKSPKVSTIATFPRFCTKSWSLMLYECFMSDFHLEPLYSWKKKHCRLEDIEYIQSNRCAAAYINRQYRPISMTASLDRVAQAHSHI